MKTFNRVECISDVSSVLIQEMVMGREVNLTHRVHHTMSRDYAKLILDLG